MSDTNDTYPEHGDEHDFADGFCQYPNCDVRFPGPNCDVRLPEPAEPEVKADHTPGYYLRAARASLANTLKQRVEYRDTIVDEIIRLQARLAEWEDQLTDVRGECEAMAAALEAIPTTKD